MRGHERERREPSARERAARVEAEPAEPEDAGAGERHREVVRERPLLRVLEALADHQRADERRDAGREVDDRAAREVERAHLEEPALVGPDPVRDRHVDERRPREDEDDVRRELHALGERAGDERRRDDREHHLERHERQRRHRTVRRRLEAAAAR